MRDWLVGADDRTGALETAAEIAAGAGPVEVTVTVPPGGSGVVDLWSRHVSPDEAAARATALPVARWNAHKTDSTLRGNWAAELRARHLVTGRRVLLVPAWPAMGRTCRGGVVHVDGAPVAAVHDQLPEAEVLDGPEALTRWLESGGPFATMDVADAAELLRVAAAVAGHDLLVAGPAGPIGAVFAARFGGGAPVAPPALSCPVLVVCGSATDVSREQLRRLRIARPDVGVLAAAAPTAALDVEVARRLAAEAHLRDAATLVVIGGDTAAAVLGDEARTVGGTVAPGMPWSRDSHGTGPVVITKAGGFGGPDALVDLFSRETS